MHHSARSSVKRLAALCIILLTLPACGVVFGAGDEGTEVFESIMLDGELTAGSAVEVLVEVNQAYPIPLAVSCRYENVDITDEERRVAFNERTQSVYERTFDANPGHEPGDDVDNEVIDFTFVVDEPGDYFIACFTVASPENGIGRGFTITD